MSSETKFLGAILIVTLVLLLGGILWLSRQESPQVVAGTSVAQIDYSKGQKIGSDSAKVRLVEFADFQCPACAAAENSLQRIRSEYPSDVQLIYRHFPLPQHAHAKKSAYFAEAAGQQSKFWQMHDKIFETQNNWSNRSEQEGSAFFLSLAKELDLDEDQLKKEMEDPDIKTRVDEDAALGRRLGVNSTPTFFLNGHKVNLQNFNDLNTLVAAELKK